MFPIQEGSTFLVQQTVSGTGVFSGTPFGRASLALFGSDASTKHLWFRAKRVGLWGNAYSVHLIDQGGTTAALQVRLAGTVLEVRMERAAGANVSTARQVADAVNAYAAAGSAPIVADYDRTTAGNTAVTPVAMTALAGGVDPVRDWPSQFKWSPALNASAGLFLFDNDHEVLVRQMGARMTITSDPTLFKVWAVNLTPGLSPILAERFPLFERELTIAEPNIGFSDGKIPVLPGQGLYVECAAPGAVVFHVRRDSRFPYP